ncbi:hypothetical protein NFI96_009596 [Prochilodus magdalenae]|nr:hypothetical protein NFI96_009596 [Prochilodus magdalenae]
MTVWYDTTAVFGDGDVVLRTVELLFTVQASAGAVRGAGVKPCGAAPFHTVRSSRFSDILHFRTRMSVCVVCRCVGRHTQTLSLNHIAFMAAVSEVQNCIHSLIHLLNHSLAFRGAEGGGACSGAPWAEGRKHPGQACISLCLLVSGANRAQRSAQRRTGRHQTKCPVNVVASEWKYRAGVSNKVASEWKYRAGVSNKVAGEWKYRAGVSDKVAGEWKYRAGVSDKVASEWKYRACVSDKVAGEWKYKAGVSDKVAGEWKYRACVSDKVAGEWKYKAGVSDKVASEWKYRACVSDKVASEWKYRACVSDKVASEWKYRACVSDKVAGEWKYKACVSDKVAGEWKYRACVSDKVAGEWKYKAGVSDKVASEWKYRACVSDKVAGEWKYRACVSDKVAGEWKYKAGVSNKVAGEWKYRACVSDKVAGEWKYRACVSDKVAGEWKYKAGVSDKVASEWKYRACVSDKVAGEWKYRGGVSNKVASEWKHMAGVSNKVAGEWKYRAGVSSKVAAEPQFLLPAHSWRGGATAETLQLQPFDFSSLIPGFQTSLSHLPPFCVTLSSFPLPLRRASECSVCESVCRSGSSTPDSLIHVYMELALCTCVRSCWSRKGPSPNCPHKVGSMRLSRVSWSAEALRVPLTGTKGRSPTPEPHPLTIIPPPPNFTLGTVQSDRYRSPGKSKPRLVHRIARRRSVIGHSREHVSTTLHSALSLVM